MAGKDSAIGVGIVGCGTIGEYMLSSWLPIMRNARVVAVSDANPARVDLYRSAYGIERGYALYEEMLADPRVDAVMVLTPNFLHAPQSILAMEAGRHVLCQKPMAMSVTEAQSMVIAAERGDVTLMAAFVKRFWPYFTICKRLIDDGALGEIRSIRSQFSHSGIGKYYKPASDWFGDRRKAGGGPLGDLGVHHFDVMRWLIGSEVAEVSAIATNISGNDNDLEDNAAVSLRFANGAMGQGFYSFTTVAPPGVTLERLEIYGTEATVIVWLSSPGRVTVRLCRNADAADGIGWIDLPVTDQPSFGLMMQHFIDCLVEGTVPVSTGVDGLRSVEIVAAGYESTIKRRSIQIAEVAAVPPARRTRPEMVQS